jgi:hypothetical protein
MESAFSLDRNSIVLLYERNACENMNKQIAHDSIKKTLSVIKTSNESLFLVLLAGGNGS